MIPSVTPQANTTREIWHLSTAEPPELHIDQIIKEVAGKWGITKVEIKSHRRFKKIVAARHDLWWRLYHETTLSLTSIGRITGGFDHTSVLYSMQRRKNVEQNQ